MKNKGNKTKGLDMNGERKLCEDDDLTTGQPW